MSDQSNEVALAALTQLAEVRGKLDTLSAMIQAQHESTRDRIADFQKSTEQRFSGIETRLGTLEKNERGTAMRTAGVAAITGALVSAGMALIKGPWVR